MGGVKNVPISSVYKDILKGTIICMYRIVCILYVIELPMDSCKMYP